MSVGPFSPLVLEKAQAVKLLAMDVDGVLTDGGIFYTEASHEIKRFDVQDGHGLAVLCHLGFPVAWITGRSSPVTQRRADELKIPHVYQHVKRKRPVLERLVASLSLTLAEVCYIGDDLPDLGVLQAVGLAICPANAVDRVRAVCHHVTRQPGGHGAVREVTDLLLNTHPDLAQQALALE